MIAWVQGELVDKSPHTCIVAASGVGYEIEMIQKDWHVLPEVGKVVTLYVQSIYREGAQLLFGFLSHHVRSVFSALNKASGVGPKMALQILDTYTIDELSLLIAQGNHIGLTKVKGIGPKLAKRLIIDLKGKIVYQSNPDKAMQTPQGQQDAIAALVRLGYKENRAREMVLKADGMSVEEIVKSALQKEMI